MPRVGSSMLSRAGSIGRHSRSRSSPSTGVRVLPGGYLGRDAGSGNPGAAYIRVALVAGEDDVRRGLTAIRETLFE